MVQWYSAGLWQNSLPVIRTRGAIASMSFAHVCRLGHHPFDYTADARRFCAEELSSPECRYTDPQWGSRYMDGHLTSGETSWLHNLMAAQAHDRMGAYQLLQTDFMKAA